MKKEVIFLVMDSGIHVKLNDNYYNFYDSRYMNHLAKDYLNYMSTTFTNCEDWECNSNKYNFAEDFDNPLQHVLYNEDIEEILKNEDWEDARLSNNLKDFVRCIKEDNR